MGRRIKLVNYRTRRETSISPRNLPAVGEGIRRSAAASRRAGADPKTLPSGIGRTGRRTRRGKSR